MYARLTITLAEDERVALQRMAESDCRYPREQMRYLLRQEACKRGLLPKDHQEKHDEEHDGKTTVAGR